MRTQRFTRAMGAAGKMVALIAAGSAALSAQDAAGTTFTPTGFFSVTGVTRSTNTGSNLPTGFGSIPFGNTISRYNAETRLSAADTTLGLKTSTTFGDGVKLNGYAALDFLGNDAVNVYGTSNSHTARIRLAYMDAFIGDWEILGGQAYSWITPNRVGLSADPQDVFYSRNVDPNYQVGLTWTRAAQIRFAYHPSTAWAMGVAFESPDQYGGQGEVTFPTNYNAQLGGQMDQGNNSAASGELPDVIAKAAYDADGGWLHVEGVGLYRRFKVAVLNPGSPVFSSASTTGSGFGLNANAELFSGFRVIGDAFVSHGGGRYIAGLGPDFVVQPNDAGNDVSLSTVVAKAFLGGVEWQMNPNNLIATYYGADFFEPNSFVDTTYTGPNQPRYIGFGGPNSANSNNRVIREYSMDYQHTLWSAEKKGAVKLLFQAAHVSRDQCFFPPGAPPRAQTNMFYTSLRYILP